MSVIHKKRLDNRYKGMSGSSEFSDSSSGSRCDRTRGIVRAGVYDELPPGAIIERVGNSNSNLPSHNHSDLSISVPANPVSELKSVLGHINQVPIHLRRKNRVMTLTVTGFSGMYGGSGLNCINMNFSFLGLPYSSQTQLIAFKYKGIHRIGKIIIDPHCHDLIRIYHDYTESTPSELGAYFEVPGFTTSWVIDDNRCRS
jgi:hypothetical protein